MAEPTGHTPAEPYTVHGDADLPHDAPAPAPTRGGPDPIALVGGLVALAIAVLALTGSLAAVDPRWVLALGALAVGGTVLLTTLRRRRP